MHNVKKERNYWPHAIIIMIGLVILACAETIVIALKNPVQMDTFYMEKYQKVDQNFNEILELQAKFNAKFDLSYSTKNFVLGENSISIKILDKESGKELENAHITLLLSRPETNENNKEMKSSKSENGNYTFGPFDIQKPGRWQILTKIESGDFKGYSKYEVYAPQ